MSCQYIVEIGIPVYGNSPQLLNTLLSIASSKLDGVIIKRVLIVNSGKSFDITNFAMDLGLRVDIEEIHSRNYWSGSVSYIYRFFKATQSNLLLLMNHDCYLEQNTIAELVRAHATLGPESICHATLLDLRSLQIWWAGTYMSPYSRHKFPFAGGSISDLKPEYIHTYSCMGQCLLLPRAAVQPRWLCENLLPHYFSDSTQSTLMRRHGFTLRVVKSAIAFTDQSDQKAKLKWLETRTLSDIVRVLFHPKSSRNLPAVFVATYLMHDHIPSKILMPFFEVIGKLLITIVEYAYHNAIISSDTMKSLVQSIYSTVDKP